MSISPEERLLIDRYLDGSLSGLELQKFMEHLDLDESFRTSVSLQNLLVEGIIRRADTELHVKLLKALSYKKPRVPMGLKLILTFLIVTASGIILWDYIDPDSSGKKNSFLSFSWLSQADKKNDIEGIEDMQIEKEQVKRKNSETGEPDNSRKENSDLFVKDEEENENKYDSSVTAEMGEAPNEVIVKKDQLLISQSLFIQEDTITEKKNSISRPTKQSTLSEDVAEKLNPSAGLEIKEIDDTRTARLLVEFWVSPINYRGYKMYRNKLVLFGMEEPDAIRLVRREGKLYMQHLNDYFLLEPTEEFTSYQTVREKEFNTQK